MDVIYATGNGGARQVRSCPHLQLPTVACRINYIHAQKLRDNWTSPRMGLTLCCLAACLGPVCPIRYYRTLLFLLCPQESLGLLDRRGGREAGYHKLWFQVWAGDCDCVRPEGRPLRAVEQDAADWPADNLCEVWREGHCGRAYHSDGVQHQDGQAGRHLVPVAGRQAAHWPADQPFRHSRLPCAQATRLCPGAD